MEDLKAAEILKSLAAGHELADAAMLQSPDVVLAAPHERTRAGIEARLVKHGRLEAEQGARLR